MYILSQLYVGSMICYLILTLQGGYSEETLDFETSLRLLYTMGNLEVGLNAFLHHDISTSLWGLGSRKGELEKKWPPKEVALL